MLLLGRSWKDLVLEAVARTTTPVHFGRAWLGWEPHLGQVRWLLSPTVPTKVLVTGRRWGKSEVAAVDLLHYAIFSPGSRQAVISVTVDQARIIFDRALAFINGSPILTELFKEVKLTPFPRLRTVHGSEITVRSTARGGTYIRGHKFHRVFVDEADYLPDSIIDEAVRMTLADTGGQLIMMSTPRRRGLLYREFRKGQAGHPDVYAQTGPTFENPNLDHDYIRRLREHMTEAAWAREVEGLFVDSDRAVFGWPHIEAAYAGADWEVPEPPAPGRTYVVGADLAKKEDFTVIIVLDISARPYRLVYFERFNRQPWPVVADRIRAAASRYRAARTLIDATGVGEAVLDELRDVAEGLVFTTRSKLDLITELQMALEKREVKFPFIRELVDELAAYELPDDKLITDCVMALALAVWAASPRYQVEFAPSIWG